MDALAASNAYNSIVSALRDAADAAAAAKRNSEEAFSVVDPQKEGSLAHLANASTKKSAELSVKLSTLSGTEAEERNARHQNSLAELEERVRGGQRNISWIRGENWESKLKISFNSPKILHNNCSRTTTTGSTPFTRR